MSDGTGDDAAMPKPSFMMGSTTASTGPSPLLAKLGAFLPQMAAANRELEQSIKKSGDDATKNVQIDISLAKDNNTTNQDDNSEGEDEDENDNHEDNEKHKQTIEMTVALGDFDSNPMIPILANHDEIDELKNTALTKTDDIDDEEDNGNSVAKMLSVTNNKSDNEGQRISGSENNSAPIKLDQPRSSKQKKVLIQEIS